MSNAARFSFKHAFTLAALALATGVTSGCTTTSALLMTGSPALDSVETASINLELDQVPVPTPSPRRAKAVEVDRKITTSSVAAYSPVKSEWCRYTTADAGAEASILRSPTLNASASDGGSKSVSLGMNLLDFAKASEIERVAQLRCEQKATEGSLQAVLLAARESNTSLGASAKADYLKNAMGRLDGFSDRANGFLAAGDITAAEASLIETRIARIRQSYAEAKVEAAKVKTLAGGKSLTVNSAASRLRTAEQQLQASNARMRTLNAMSVNVESGWSRKDSTVFSTDSGNGQFYGKVSFGLRIGAVSPSRMRYEEEAQNARVAALGEAYTGIVWQSDRALETVISSRKHLTTSRHAIAAALSESRQTLANLRETDRPELSATLLIAEIDTISLASELAAIDASLAGLKDNSDLVSSVNR